MKSECIPLVTTARAAAPVIGYVTRASGARSAVRAGEQFTCGPGDCFEPVTVTAADAIQYGIIETVRLSPRTGEPVRAKHRAGYGRVLLRLQDCKPVTVINVRTGEPAVFGYGTVRNVLARPYTAAELRHV